MLYDMSQNFKKLPRVTKNSVIIVFTIMITGLFLSVSHPASGHEYPRDHVHVSDVETLALIVSALPPGAPIFVGETPEEYRVLKLPLSDYALPPGAYIEPAIRDVKKGWVPVFINWSGDKLKDTGSTLGKKKEAVKEAWHKAFSDAKEAEKRDDMEESVDPPVTQKEGDTDV